MLFDLGGETFGQFRQNKHIILKSNYTGGCYEYELVENHHSFFLSFFFSFFFGNFYESIYNK